MGRINVTKWAVGLVTVLGLALGLANKVAATNATMSLVGTAWTAPLKLDDGREVVVGLGFKNDREYLLMIGDPAQQRIAYEAKGTYTLVNGNLKLFDADGKLVGDEVILSLTSDRLVTKAEGKTTVWTRLPLDR